MRPDHHPIYTTPNGTVVYVSKAGKSQYNFKVRYQEPGKGVRTLKHIHLIIDLYMKRTGDKSLTMRLVDHVIDEIVLKVNPPSNHSLQPTAPSARLGRSGCARCR